MRFDIHNLILELILTLVALFWWLRRTPNTSIICRRKSSNSSSNNNNNSYNYYVFWPGIGPTVHLNAFLPFESLLVNIASLSGTVLSDMLRPSQAIFSIGLVLHDAWPLLFVTTNNNNNNNNNNNEHHQSPISSPLSSSSRSSSSSIGTTPPPTARLVPHRRNWIRLGYISVVFLFIYFLLDVVFDSFFIIHHAAVMCAYLAGVGAMIVALRHIADFGKQVRYQEQQLQRIHGDLSSNNEHHQTSLLFESPPAHDILETVAVASSTAGNVLQHWALISTYWVYAVMLLVDFTSMTESGPWLLYCTGSVLVEVVKHFWLHRMRSLNVDTVV